MVTENEGTGSTGESTSRMTFDEAMALLSHFEKTKDEWDWAKANDAVASVSGRRLDRRVITPMLRVVGELFRIEARGRSLAQSPLTDHEREEVKDRAGYKMSVRQVRTFESWFLFWRQEQARQLERVRLRLRSLVEQIWVPDPLEVPSDLLRRNGGFRAREISGNPFRWEQEIVEEPGKRPLPKITRCWMHERDERWLKEEVIDRLDQEQAEQLWERYQSLQVRVCDWLQQVAAYREYEISAFSEAQTSLAQIDWNLKEGAPPPYPEGWDRGRELLDRGRSLYSETVIFQDDLLRAVETDT